MCGHIFQVSEPTIICIIGFTKTLVNIWCLWFLACCSEDMDLAVKYIENLTKVPRFNMIVMCLTSREKNGTSFVSFNDL